MMNSDFLALLSLQRKKPKHCLL